MISCTGGMLNYAVKATRQLHMCLLYHVSTSHNLMNVSMIE